MRIFDRFWELTLTSNPNTQSEFTYVIKPDDFGNSLRISFDIQASLGLENYSGTVNIYNLDPDKRKNLLYNQLLEEFGSGPSIKLVAGYKEKSGIILDGVVQRGFTVREPLSGDWITKLKCGLAFKNDQDITIPAQKITNDQLFAFLTSWIDAVLPEGTGVDSNNRYRTKRAKNFFDNLSDAADAYSEIATLNTSIGYSGPVAQIINEIEKKFGLHFYYDNEGLNVTTNIVLDGTDELEISQNTGMIGSPIYTDTGAKVKTYLKPEYRLMQQVRVNSEILDKRISIVSMNHSGDSHTNDWFSDIDASNIGQVLSNNGPDRNA